MMGLIIKISTTSGIARNLIQSQLLIGPDTANQLKACLFLNMSLIHPH